MTQEAQESQQVAQLFNQADSLPDFLVFQLFPSSTSR